MLDHHLQRAIVYTLAFEPKARFSELKPDDIDSKLFTYHLKKVVKEGYISKNVAGEYSLTPAGRRLSTGVLNDHQSLIVERPLSTLLLVIRRKSDNAWLFYERNTHPMLGYQGFMHCQPEAGSDCAATAQKQCFAKTGLTGSFTALGGGYIRVYEGETLESYTHFTLLFSDNIQGDLVQHDKQATYSWIEQPDFSSPTLFPSTQQLKELYEAGQPFFIEQTFKI